jgi:hypothetical protein
MHDPEGPSSAASLLGFLTLKEWDIEEEYFENYTPRQLAFRDNEAENVSAWEYYLLCPQCGTEEPEEEDFDPDNPPAWFLGADPDRCDSCGSLL